MVLNKSICLNLNSAWQPIGVKTVKEAVSDLFAGTFQALNIEYECVNNKYNFDEPVNMTPLKWDEWIKLPVREFDLVVRSTKLKVRVPTVLITKRYSKMPIARLKPTTEGIRKRDDNICQYTGKKLKRSEGSVDHILPKARGGDDSWSNMVYCEKKLNTIKSNRTPNEAGLKLIKQPREPMGKPICAILNEEVHIDWKLFMI
tara:strand:+ start:6261 stop:6866 length:606 start_codon:yes stop_codon:yes gene_type:complete